MFKKILVANRGEIALRVIFACRELGIKTVAVYSEADENSLHVRFADEDICIGPARSGDSYLNVPAIISAAEITGADAMHPGYGFLSESAYLAEVCEACHIRFIGPDPSVIRLLGDKAKARRAMKKAGVPMLPGSDGPVESEERATKIAQQIGYPVIIKAVAGGGGRGMRIVKTPADLPHAFKTAQREAESAFGVGDVYIEKYLESPRHIEFQVLGDHHGNVVHLGERECSIQRRHQKLLEESPSVAVSDKVRRKMGALVVDAARAVQYTNAGTFEFLMDEKGNFFFMEVNTRIQVEHPVTEMVTGIDIVKEQIRIAAGERLGFKQSEVTFTGHAIECRVNAEDPETFVPSPGMIHAFSIPGGPGVRVDTAAHSECMISPYYDSMIAKVIVHGRDRQESIARMKRTLEMSVVEGIRTTIPLHLKILNDPDFIAGRLSTHFMERFAAKPKATALASLKLRLTRFRRLLLRIVDAEVCAAAGRAPVDVARAFLAAGRGSCSCAARRGAAARFSISRRRSSKMPPSRRDRDHQRSRRHRGAVRRAWRARRAGRSVARATCARVIGDRRDARPVHAHRGAMASGVREPISYLAIGPVFGTGTKRHRLRRGRLEVVRARVDGGARRAGCRSSRSAASRSRTPRR